MKILVCFKFIRDEEGISVNADRTINLDSAPWVISPYDLNAIEAGMKLAAEAHLGSTWNIYNAGSNGTTCTGFCKRQS